MATEKIEQWVDGLLTVAVVSREGEDAYLHTLLHHLFVAVKLHDMASDEDRRKVQQVIKLTKRMFFSKFSLKERKRKTKKQKGLPLAHPTKEKETNKEKAEKHIDSSRRENIGLDEEQQAFWQTLVPYIGEKYSEEMVKTFFYQYGQRVSKNGKMLWQTEKKWTLSLRLAAWSRRSYNVNDELAAIRLKKAKQRQKEETASVSQQQMVAEMRAAADARREAEQAEAKAGSVSLEEYLATHPGSTLKMLKK